MKKLSTKAVIVILGILSNIIGRSIADVCNLPIWFDMVGTIFATYFTGIWGGLITGILNNVISCFFDFTALIYMITSVVAVFTVNFFVKKGYMDYALKAIVSSFMLGVICTVVSTPLNLIFYDGYSGNFWGDTLVDMMRWYDVSDIWSAISGELVVEIVDKQICILFAYLIIRGVKRCEFKKNSAVKAISMLMVLGIIGAYLLPMFGAYAAEPKSQINNFVETIYNNTNGMVSSEANTICETDDGYIWIGSYAGLSRYDGSEFEFIREGGLVNVVGMMKDSKGRLWIGTNDAGIARYENGSFTYFTSKDGLPSNSVRCFAEGQDGVVYVGTSDKLCKFNSDDKIEVINQNVTFVKSMVVFDGILVVVDNRGGLYAIDGDKLLSVADNSKSSNFYNCLAYTSRGIVAGTEVGEIVVFDITKDGIVSKDKIENKANVVSAVFEDSRGRLWMATEMGFGYIGNDGQFRQMSYKGFDSSIERFYEDYQGNIWIASSSYGVMKLSESPFVNIFKSTGIEAVAVNAVINYNGNFYCGTDNGLIVLDENFNYVMSELSEMIGTSRVRAFMEDSQSRLWICTYNGLICYSKYDGVKIYSTENGTTSNRFRCITELKDGTIVTGTADGINFIKDDTVTKTLGAKDGLGNTQILTIIERDNGDVLAGSDGSGVYVISEYELKSTYNTENGLSSDVILRLVPSGNGHFAVTSNRLCHIDLNGEVKEISSFPYFNNYDIVMVGEDAYVTCSAGIYKTGISELYNDDAKRAILYGANEGLFSGLTANSWNYVSPDGRLYLCSNDGVTLFSYDTNSMSSDLKCGIVAVECDGERIEFSNSNEIYIPANVKEVAIYASVRNFAYTDAKVRFFVLGEKKISHTYNWNEIEPIRIFKPNFSEVNVCIQVLDSSGKDVIQEKIYTVHKEANAWQTPLYKVYLVLVCFEIFLFSIFSIVSIVLFIIRKNELENIQQELAEKVEEQTSELKIHQDRIKELYVQTITALSEAVEAKDRYTSGHSIRVAEYSRMIAERMGKSVDEQEEIYRAGLLHDVGKIRIPEEIINKAGKLTDEEFGTIKIHPVTGYQILRGISESNMIALAAKYHHERYDGKGYPNGLEGEKIPEFARILGVADSYDAMTSNRSYRKALPQEVVRGEIEKGKGVQFDPEIADIMLKMIDEDVNYTMKQEDEVKRVLTVDDEPMNNMMIAHIMRDKPMYEVVAVNGGREALEMLAQQSFDLIMLDVMMPEMDGLETLKRIRERYQTPVVLMTGDKGLDTSTGFAQLGCDDYITKPFLPLVIKEVIHNMTKKQV